MEQNAPGTLDNLLRRAFVAGWESCLATDPPPGLGWSPEGFDEWRASFLPDAKEDLEGVHEHDWRWFRDMHGGHTKCVRCGAPLL